MVGVGTKRTTTIEMLFRSKQFRAAEFRIQQIKNVLRKSWYKDKKTEKMAMPARLKKYIAVVVADPVPPPRVVVSDRMGGLGNQLFQYAAACAVAHHHPRTRVLVGPERLNGHNCRGHDYARILMRRAEVVDTVPGNTRVFAQGGSFLPWLPDKIVPPVRLEGYFQYYPAIAPVLDGLVAELREALRPYDRREVPPGSVFMHVRRGDYLGVSHLFYIQEKEYYEEAYRKLCNGDGRVFFLTDDPAWCRGQEWSFEHEVCDIPDELEALAFMARCGGGAVIGNSTFGYWGALLSGARQVFYPAKWIRERVYDLFPPHWSCVGG